MKNMILSLTAALVMLFILSCEKQQDKGPDILNITGFRSGYVSEVVNIKLKSGKVTSGPVECYQLASTLYDPSSGGFGYVDCQGMFYLLDPRSGDTLIATEVPEYLSQIVVDTVYNMLIGQRFEEGLNYIYKINLQTGETEARNPVDLSPGIFTCTYFYKTQVKEYGLMRADSTLVYIDPENGETVYSVKAATALSHAVYHAPDDLLIGVTYNASADASFLVTLDATTGQQVQQVEIEDRNDYYACMSGFDAVTNCYVLLNADNKILFIDIETGKVKDSYRIGFQVQEFKFWRGE